MFKERQAVVVKTQTKVVGVIGSGTMGLGIVQVALLSGYQVRLYDVSQSALDAALRNLEKRLLRLVEKGRMVETEVQTLLERVTVSTELNVMKHAFVVIEAIPEKLSLKQELFAKLDNLCPSDTILASNTSSLSITVLGAATNRPHKVIGLHFFNPAPVMKLVEVIAGEDTSPETVQEMVSLAESLDKVPAICQDTPGFIVNRVARNFYGEALRIVAEGSASVEQVDALLTQCAGFRMGPFRLMDLIGIDVNLDVTKAVYNAYHQEPRYRPHALQSRMVESGRLGQKTGRGFYTYGSVTDNPAETTATADLLGSGKRGQRAVVIGDTAVALHLLQRLSHVCNKREDECGIVYPSRNQPWDLVNANWRADEVEAYLRKTKPEVVFVSLADSPSCSRRMMQAIENAVSPETVLAVSLSGPSATKQASWLRFPKRVRGFNVVLPLQREQAIEWSRPLQADSDVQDTILHETFIELGFTPLEIRDGAGGVQMRVLSMVLNEAAEAIREKVASPEDVDVAMKLGTNYPHGPAAWTDVIGVPVVLSTLEALSAELGDDRYRPSPLLQQMVDAGHHGREAGRGWYTY